MSEFLIREARREDLPAILEIYNDAVFTTTATYDTEPRTLEHRVGWFEEHGRTGHPIFVAVDEGNRVVGWASLNRYHDRAGYRFTVDNSIYVAAEQRGKGIGGKLLDVLVAAAREKQYRAVIAIIDADNKQSVYLHEKVGFKVVGHFEKVGYKFNRWLDVIYMELLLPEPEETKAKS